MARLTETEQKQIRQAAASRIAAARPAMQPVAHYLSFLQFARRVAPADPRPRIAGGRHWKL